MIYLEELVPGDIFVTEAKESYLLTCDFKNKNNPSRLAISLNNGFPVWLNSSTVVYKQQIYYQDEDNNIVPFKETKKCSIN